MPRTLLLLVMLFAIAAALAPGAHAASSPYTDAPFTLTTNPYAYGQAPAFLPDGRVLFGKDFKQGDKAQVYVTNQDGSGLKCLTCDMKPADNTPVQPNNVPVTQPGGKWVLFHSWIGHHIVIGAPGYGGLGSELWVMRPDGSHKVQLTGLDAAHGAGEGEDDYHAYWSPDGKHLVWAHLNWNFITNNGDGKWDVRVADFVDDGVHPPHLANERVVRPANGHWYETQWWAPDGSGFLYTETWGTAMDTELFFCKLTPKGCDVRQLTDTPSWNEQAIFTPDGKDVIYMSSRDAPGLFNTFAEVTKDLGIPADEDWLLTLPVFEAAFLQPVGEETTDLYLIDLATGSQRRLTEDGKDGWITPEFTWDPQNKRLVWTENRLPPGERVGFPLDAASQLQKTSDFLQHPPPPYTGGTNALDLVYSIEQRTRILEFRLPKSGVRGERHAKKKATHHRRHRKHRRRHPR